MPVYQLLTIPRTVKRVCGPLLGESLAVFPVPRRYFRRHAVRSDHRRGACGYDRR